MGITKLMLEWLQLDGGTQARAAVRREAATLRSRMVQEAGDCEVCGFGVTNVLQVHHMIPVAQGGDNHPGRMAVLCPNCHALVHEARRRCFCPSNAPQDQRGRSYAAYAQFKTSLENEMGELMAERILALGQVAGHGK